MLSTGNKCSNINYEYSIYFQLMKFNLKMFWFGLDKCQVPTKLLYHSSSSGGQGRGDMMEGSRAEIRTGGDHSPVTVMDKTD